MKRVLLILALSVSLNFAYGQKAIDSLFDRYSGTDGFVSVTLRGDLLRFIRSHMDNDEKCKLPMNITEIRLLVQENENTTPVNFYDLVTRDLNLTGYEELMKVKETGQELRMLVRTEGDYIREFLMVGGGEDNLLIQIKGKITFEEAETLCSDSTRDHGSGLISELN